MALTIGGAPFGNSPAGVFNFQYDAPDHVLYFEDFPRRVRAVFAGRTLADSREAKLMHETGHLPVYYFPERDLDDALLEATDHSTHCPFKGDASWWSIRVGDRIAENAAWAYPKPLPGAPALAGYVALEWKAIDTWLEEDDEVHGHPRDPYTRIDVRESSRHVRVTAGGEPLAETRRPKMLFETSLPPRAYIPPADVRRDLLEPSATRTYCPYKGHAVYWSARLPAETVVDVAWSYSEPFPEAERVLDHLCFDLGGDVVVELDGERVEPRRR